MKLIGLVIVSLLPRSIFSQIAGNNYVPFNLEDTNIDWSHVSKDSTIDGHLIEGSTATFDGYSHLRQFYDLDRFRLIEEGYLYQIHRTMFDNDISGALIEKIDIETGELIWNIVYDQRTQERREFLSRAKIENGSLLLYNLLITTDDPEPIDWPVVALGWAEGYLKIREYDLISGELIHESIPDTSLSLKLIQNHSFDEAVMSIKDDFISVYTHNWSDNGPSILIDSINLSGQLINSTDTLYSLLGDLDWANSWQADNHLMYIDEEEDKFYWMDFYTKQPWSVDSTRANINVYHDNSIELIEVNFPDKHNVQTFSIIDVDSGRILLKLFYPDETISYVLLDEDGTFFWKVDLVSEGIRFIQVDDLSDFVLVTDGGTTDGKSQINIMKYEDGNLEERGKVVLADENYYMYPYEIQSVSDNEFLISVEYRENINPYPLQGSFRSIFKVDGKHIGINPSVFTEDIENDMANINVFPNPFLNYFSFYSEKQKGNMRLYSSSGHLLLSQKIEKGHNTAITSEISNGIYYLSLQYEDFKITKAISKN